MAGGSKRLADEFDNLVGVFHNVTVAIDKPIRHLSSSSNCSVIHNEADCALSIVMNSYEFRVSGFRIRIKPVTRNHPEPLVSWTAIGLLSAERDSEVSMAYSAKGRIKNYPVFDCDSHIYEPPEVWDQYIPQANRDFAKTHFYRDADRLFLVRNSRISFRDPDKWKYPGETWHPGLTKKIIGQTEPGTREWDEIVGRNRSARDPHVRLKDMDASGIDQVMIFPSTFVYLPLVENADAAYICSRAYNDWVFDYCSADKKRLFPAAVLPTQNVDFAIEELRRVAKRGFKSALVRPIIAQGKYPTFPEYDPLWREFEELGVVLGMHTFPSRGEAMSPELDKRMGANRKRLFSDEEILVYSPGQFVANIMQVMGSKQAGDAAYGFIAEAMTWTGVVLMTGWLENFRA
jgi:hypothetical protein